MGERERKGRAFLLVFIGLVLLASAGITAGFVLVRGTDRLTAQLVRLGLTAVLCLFVYSGSRGARWLTVALCGGGGFLALLQAWGDDGLTSVFAGGLAALYLSFAGVLLFSPSIRAFLEYQRQELAREQERHQL